MKWLIFISTLFLSTSSVFAFTDSEIASYQKEISDRPIGDRIAIWAERFLGTPYDTDPIGDYVTKRVIVNDDRVDCMYLSFRALELALGRTPDESIEIALDKRFTTKGVLKDGYVINYDERFQYGEDMLDSGKWGVEITRDIGDLRFVNGSRGRDKVAMISRDDFLLLMDKGRMPLKNGDFIYFVKDPGKRQGDEIIGHIGIIKREGDKLFLIHASGSKNKGGKVKKVLLYEYIKSMPFVGIRIGRFTTP
jgi:hypothetical protein